MVATLLKLEARGVEAKRTRGLDANPLMDMATATVTVVDVDAEQDKFGIPSLHVQGRSLTDRAAQL